MRYCLAIILLHSLILVSCQTTKSIPSEFVYVRDIVPSIEYELRYYSTNNFMGRHIEAYKDSVLILSQKAAKQLKKVQKDLNKMNFGLKVFDAYRPQTAVNHFIRWAKDDNDTLMKHEFYPELNKTQLFPLGYISTRSGHTRGSTVDLTIIDLDTHKELDMGGPYDYFGELSHHGYEDISTEAQQNRLLLKEAMMKYNFKPYANEWWHYTLNEEPFPETYFDFPVAR